MTDATLRQDHADWLMRDRAIGDTTITRAPIASRGNALAFLYPGFAKLRGVPAKKFWIEPAGIALSLWNLATLDERSSSDTTLVITEGEIDAMSCMEAGAAFVVSVPNGAPARSGAGDINPLEDQQFRYLWQGDRLLPQLQPWRRIILATDDDPPGLVLREELAVRLGRPRCWYVSYPAGCKDANDVLRKHGSDALARLLDDAKPIVPNKLVPFSDIPPNGRAREFLTGWGEGMDRHLRIVPPELMIVTGVPGSGKSTWSLALAARLAMQGLPGAILQFEDDPDRNREDLLRFRRTRGDQCGNEQACKWLDRYVRTIAPSEDLSTDVDFTLEWLTATIDEACTRHGARWVLIDPWNELEHIWGGGESETAYTTKALKDLKRIARRYQIALIIVTHPSKSGGQIKSVDEMSLYDVSGSAAWKNKADHGIIVHRAGGVDKTVSIKIDKSKNFSKLGMPGIVKMEFLAASSDYRVVE